MEAVSPPSPVVVVVWALGVVLELIAVPVALFLLWRGGYRTRSNIVITLLAAVPPAIVVLGVLIFLFGHVHM
jgi:hypothetical protein